MRTTAGSGMLSNFISPYESTVTQKLLDSGAVMLGKTNTDEFGMGSTNTNSYFGPVVNPWSEKKGGEELVPGGSSGGSAAATTAGLCMASTGTDTGGSVRQPGSYCGIVGIKPTYGRCSRFGVIAFANSLDQPGVLARSVRDGAIMLETMMGYDPKDSTSTNLPVPRLINAIDGNIKGMKIGIPTTFRGKGNNKDIEQIWDQSAKFLQDQGAELVEISLPHSEYAVTVYYIIAPAEASSNLACYDGIRYGATPDVSMINDKHSLYQNNRSLFGEEVKRRIMIGTHVLAAGYHDQYYNKAQKVRKLIIKDFNQAFEEVDVILTPTAANTSLPIKEKLDPVSIYMNDIFTIPASLAGLPAMSVPCGYSNELPVGMQIIGKRYDEASMLRVAGVLEGCTGFKGFL